MNARTELRHQQWGIAIKSGIIFTLFDELALDCIACNRAGLRDSSLRHIVSSYI